MLFKKKGLLGLDIGSSSIKIAEVIVGKKGHTLQNFGLIPTPPQATSGGDIVDANLLVETIRHLLTEIKTKNKNTVTGLWGASVIVKRISIPRMEEALIADQIRWEAEQYIPYDINEVHLDYKILKVTPSDSDTMDILLIAAVQEMIFNCAEIVTASGLTCVVLDVEGFALANCFEANYGVLHGELLGLLNIGSSVTNFVVVEDGEVIFCRDIPMGGLTYTNELAKSLGLSMTEAEGIKLAVGSGQAVPEEAGAVIESTHETVIEEINGSIEFFNNTNSGATLSRLFLTGGGSKTTGLFQAISQVLPCERFNPFQTVKASGRAFSEAYINQIRDYSAISIGLSLRTLGDS